MIGAHLGSEHPLLFPDGTHTLWGWTSTSGVPGETARERTQLARHIPEYVRVSLGMPGRGPAGFRQSHGQALRARRIVELAGKENRVTSYADLALVDTMSNDLELARAFVAAELGALAVAGSRESEERRALLAVLDAQGGLAAAGEELGIHRNTVLQRMRRAEERRGRPATDRIAELHAALRLVDVLGPVVLAPDHGTAT